MKNFECFIKNKSIKNCKSREIYYFNKKVAKNIKNFIDVPDKKILTCLDCGISYASGFLAKELDQYYSSVYGSKNLEIGTKNIFFEYNRRFFSQVTYYLQFFKIYKKIKVLEIGPNIQGILPTLKLFEKNIEYYYIDQTDSDLINSRGGKKIDNYYYPFKTKIPKVDLIWMSHSMEHIAPNDLKNTFQHLSSVLKPRGKIFIEIPNDILINSFDFPHTLFYTEKFLNIFFKSLKFNIRVITKFDHDLSNNLFDKTLATVNRYKIYNLLIIIGNILPLFIKNIFIKVFYKNFIFFALKNNQYSDEQRPFIRLIIERK